MFADFSRFRGWTVGWIRFLCGCHCHLNRRKSGYVDALVASYLFISPHNPALNVWLNKHTVQLLSRRGRVSPWNLTLLMHFSPSHLTILPPPPAACLCLLQNNSSIPAIIIIIIITFIRSQVASRLQRRSAEVCRSAYFKFCTSSPLLTYSCFHVLPPLHSLNVHFLSRSN